MNFKHIISNRVKNIRLLVNNRLYTIKITPYKILRSGISLCLALASSARLNIYFYYVPPYCLFYFKRIMLLNLHNNITR